MTWEDGTTPPLAASISMDTDLEEKARRRGGTSRKTRHRSRRSTPFHVPSRTSCSSWHSARRRRASATTCDTETPPATWRVFIRPATPPSSGTALREREPLRMVDGLGDPRQGLDPSFPDWPAAIRSTSRKSSRVTRPEHELVTRIPGRQALEAAPVKREIGPASPAAGAPRFSRSGRIANDEVVRTTGRVRIGEQVEDIRLEEQEALLILGIKAVAAKRASGQLERRSGRASTLATPMRHPPP